MNKPSEGERTNLTGQEYFALRSLMGIVSTFATEDRVLKNRLKKVPMGWCDVKMIEAKADRLLDAVLATIPAKKLAQIRQEIGHSRVEISVVRDVTGAHKKAFTYVPNEALEWLEDQVIDLNCMMCDKTEKESRKCPVRRNIEALYQYDFPERKGCPIAQMNIERNGDT